MSLLLPLNILTYTVLVTRKSHCPWKCDVLRDLVPFVQFKKVKHFYGGVLLLVKLQTSACNFTNSNNPSCVFFTFIKLNKWYQIAQSITNFWTDSMHYCYPYPPTHTVLIQFSFKFNACGLNYYIPRLSLRRPQIYSNKDYQCFHNWNPYKI